MKTMLYENRGKPKYISVISILRCIEGVLYLLRRKTLLLLQLLAPPILHLLE